MSYIRAHVFEQEDPAGVEHGFALSEVDFSGDHDLDMDMDSEILSFVLGVIGKIDNLAEGEALVIWKEIF